MANAILAHPYPYGNNITQRFQEVYGSVVLCGSAVTTGEPLNWSQISTGIGYNEINFVGNGVNGSGAAFTTGFAISAGVCTVTANNNFLAGQTVTFVGNTQTLSAKFNGVRVQIVSATSTTFTFNTATTGTTTTGDVGIAYNPPNFMVNALSGPLLTASVTAISASGTTLTATAANYFLPGAYVQFAGFSTGTLGAKLIAAGPMPVISSTGTAFTATMPSALTGTTGTGTAAGQNPPQPHTVRFWSHLDSGYIYQYNAQYGTLFVENVPASSALTNAAPLTPLAAAAYPAGVLADVIRFEAKFAKDR